MEIDLELLLQVFRGEAEEHLTALEESLLQIETHPEDREALHNGFRAVHTLKGSAATVSLSAITDFAHHIEDLFDGLREHRLTPTRPLTSHLLECVDVLRQLLDYADAPPPELRSRCAALALYDGLQSQSDPGSVQPLAEPPRSAESRQATEQRRSSMTLRVGIHKLDRLLDLAGEIVIARASFQQLLMDVPGRTGERLREAFRDSARLTLELQEQVSSVRMVPVGPTLRQYVRVARDLSIALGKQVRVELEGEDVEVDAAVIEHLKDPLTHMVRNAIDHGLEAPEARRAKGKPPCGKLVLRAFHRGSSIVIEGIDDGVGLDRERILERARARGLHPDGLAPSNAAVFSLVFEEGFSTADTITDLSGRGVGMGVVRKNVEALGGSVRIHGTPDRGTTVALQLPLTLAILEVLTVVVGDDTCLIPLATVIECFDLPREETGSASGWVARTGSRLPWIRLSELLSPDGAESAESATEVVLVHCENRRVGLAVTSIMGSQQVVIKPLSRLFRGLPAVAGCTILHSGRVALILDVKSLLDLADARADSATGSRAQQRREAPEVHA